MIKRIILAVALMLCILISQSQSIKFAVICDTRSNGSNSGLNGVNVAAIKAVCHHLKQNGAEFILAPGDFICGNVTWFPNPPSNDKQYQAFLDALSSQGIGLPGSKHEIILYPVRGNHECYQQILPGDSIRASWMRNIGYSLPENGPENEIGYTYSFVYKHMLFMALDQYIYADSTQKKNIKVNQQWIDQSLQKYPDVKHVFAFGHTPAFAAHHKDCLAEFPDKRNTFLRSIYSKSGVYFCGHDHFYARGKIPVYSQEGKIQAYMQQVITPSGAPFLGDYKIDSKWTGIYPNDNVIPITYYDNVVGYQLVTIENKTITVEFVATKDACNYWMDSKGAYHYTYNDNWESWDFRTWDKFSYSIKK